MAHPSPNLAPHRPAGPQEPPPSHSVPPPQGQPYTLPGMNQAGPGQGLMSHPSFEREREVREREIREREAFEEQARRERDIHDREMHERQQREQGAAHQEQLQLHQPVAVGPRMQTAIHGPNGLLASGGPPSASQPPTAQNGAMSLFGQHYEGAPRGALQQAGQIAQSMITPFAGPGMPQMPVAPLAPGQQPILNASYILFAHNALV